MRVALKIVGASGQGINSVGEILAKGLKREGYCVFGYREYPSLIKGGHASYQLDISDRSLRSSAQAAEVLVCFNHHGLERNLPDLKADGIVVHQTPGWTFTEAQQALMRDRRLRAIELPVDAMLNELDAVPILGNVLIAAFLWSVLGLDAQKLKDLVGERFARKRDLLERNMRCIEAGYAHLDPTHGRVSVPLPVPDPARWQRCLLLRCAEAMGLGAVHAGVRFYAGYPMTPSSPLLSYIAEIQNKTGMVVKQAEDEITAAQMVCGAMHMGTRALTATSGGGFDLMTETLSMSGMIESPSVFVLAMRPGPATGNPTWTAQGDLLLACFGGHGEFPRCVLAASDPEDSFSLMAQAFNLAEEFQLPVIVLTDKQLMEGLFTVQPFDQSRAQVNRGSRLVTDPACLKALQGSDRYQPHVPDGVSARWLPGMEAATYAAQADEHGGGGTVDESAENAEAQADKRLRKIEALRAALPEPELYGDGGPDAPVDTLIVGWGSTKTAVLDVLRDPEVMGHRTDYLHYTALWPLKTELFQTLAARAKRVILLEGNSTGQLGRLLCMECGVQIPYQIVKYDGRPFFYDELKKALLCHLRESAAAFRESLLTSSSPHP